MSAKNAPRLKSSKLPKFAIVNSGDEWQGLYINGKLVDETHHFNARDLFEYMGIDVKYYTQSNAAAERMSETGDGLPGSLADAIRK